MKPKSTLENKLLKKGIKHIVGLDEAGRGALAGPIVAGAVVFPNKNNKLYRVRRINDSKKLTKAKRVHLFSIIQEKSAAWAVGIVSAEEIDEIGIARANLLAFERAIDKIRVFIRPEYLLIDYFKAESIPLPQESITKGDQKVYTIAAASVIAKVFRDSLMKAEARRRPEYGFEQHVGYGTKKHIDCIKKYGQTDFHRKSFSF